MALAFTEFLVGAYIVVFLLVMVFPAATAPPIGYVTSFFLVKDPFVLALYLFIMVFFIRKLEKKIGTNKFIVAYLLAGVVGNLGLFHIGAFEAETMLAKGGVMGLLGLLVALDPYAIVFEEIVPLPAIVVVIFLIVVKFLLENSLEVMPLLIGMLLGYLWKSGIEHPRLPSKPAQPWRR
ncbi:MAG: rhomboid family intramembrane serine protease [Candidatus Micrarchaeota archaeon]|nr:rhomboid family intramembrane serine protease [Candidatus Micrarchaeota archaeon]